MHMCTSSSKHAKKKLKMQSCNPAFWETEPFSAPILNLLRSRAEGRAHANKDRKVHRCFSQLLVYILAVCGDTCACMFTRVQAYICVYKYLLCICTYFQSFPFIVFNWVYGCGGGMGMSIWRQRLEVSDSAGAGVMGDDKQPGVGARNWTRVVCKSSTPS